MNKDNTVYISNALWPEGTFSSPDGTNITTDRHPLECQAKIICEALKREGFGGLGKVFPIKTWVSMEVINGSH